MSGRVDQPLIDPEAPDEDSPEWTDEGVRRAVRVSDFGSLTAVEAELLRRNRTPHRLVAIDKDIVERFKSGGPDWPVRLNAALRKAVAL